MNPSTSPRLQALDFHEHIQYLTEGFVGRERIFKEIDSREVLRARKLSLNAMSRSDL